MKYLEILATALTDRAEEVQRAWPGFGVLTVTRGVAEMEHKQLRLEEAMASADPYGGPLVLEGELPNCVLSLAIGHHRILIGALDERAISDGAQAELRRYLNQAAIAWSWLGQSGDDLLLILVGPEGKDDDGEWQQAVSAIERDERVCRKLVWLPRSEPGKRDKSLQALIDRTFLARPWPPSQPDAEDGAPAISSDLDLMARLFARVTQGGLSAVEARRWIEILTAPEEQPDLAEKLVAALEIPA
ncbi:ABC-three component system middle component 1 [Azospirillum largimobile]